MAFLLRKESFIIGIDVGTESVRAGLFAALSGEHFAVAKRPIKTWKSAKLGTVEQSTEQIWRAIVDSVRELMAKAKKILPASALDDGDVPIGGIGFCATCSLAVVDARGRPLPVGKAIVDDHMEQPEDGDGEKEVRNVIVWMDQRALAQAERINASGHPTLRFTGGRMSPEMQTPKLLWLKEHVPDTFARAEHFFDLADFLTWRATGSTERSICTLTCKWTFVGHEQRWDTSFFHAVDLSELVEEKFRRIGKKILPVGSPVGNGLSPEAAVEFGLPAGTQIAAGMIDAHSGALGTLVSSKNSTERRRQMTLILGTSLCAMSLTKEPCPVNGVWGPYFGVVWPDHWLNEGGMTAFGSALLFALQFHPRWHRQLKKAKQKQFDECQLLDQLEQLLVNRFGSVENCSASFGAHIHIVPEFLGNRSPDANPQASAMIAGIRMDDPMWAERTNDETETALALAQWMVIVMSALCYGIKEIIDQIELQSGAIFDELVVSGGMVRSSLLLRLIADITQKWVFVPHCAEPVLLGAAICGAVASGTFPSIHAASSQMVHSWGHLGRLMEPQRDAKVLEFHNKKFKAYKAMKRCERTINES